VAAQVEAVAAVEMEAGAFATTPAPVAWVGANELRVLTMA
jgi:hypothetical protein